MKKIFLVAMALLMAVLPVFAGDTLIRWDWLNNDSEVQYYRYQVDGTDPALWTVVDGFVSSYETDSLDPYVDHTLYLEGSYDGIYWSDTASAVAYALEQPVLAEAEAAPVEEAAVVEELPAEEVALVEEVPVEEAVVEEVVPEVEAAPVVEPVAPAPVAEKPATNDFAFSLYLKGGLISSSTLKPFNLDFDGEFKAGLGLDFANVIKLGNSMGFGFRTDFDAIAVPASGFRHNMFNGAYMFTKQAYESLMMDGTALLTFTARNRFVGFNLGLGGGVSFAYPTATQNQTADFNIGSRNIKVGAFGALNTGVRFYMGIFSVGLEGTVRMMLPNWQDIRYAGDVVLGFTF